jgi:hypothetical protein
MIVEPQPTSPRSPARRTLRLVGVAAPIVLLAGIVGAALLGPRPAGAPSPDSSAVAAVSGRTRDPASDPASDRTGDERGDAATQAASDRPVVLSDGTTTTFPETWIGFRVRSVAETRAERQAGGAAGIVAVAGYFSYGSLSWTCADAYLDASGCDGRTLLADEDVLPTPENGGVFGAIGPHLHPTFAQGVRAPAPDGSPSDPHREPIPVVVLGRYTDPVGVPCSPTSRDCGQAFAVDRVVWVAGRPWGETLSVDPAMDVEPTLPRIPRALREETDAHRRSSLPLDTSVLRRDLLPVVDAAAADALPAVQPGDEYRPVTYVRGLVFQFDASQPLYGRDPQIGWVVLKLNTGEVLARGGPAGPGAPSVGAIVTPASAPTNQRSGG